jgi:hypothetical protein
MTFSLSFPPVAASRGGQGALFLQPGVQRGRKYVAQGRAEGKAEGNAEGKAEALLTVLTARGLPITDLQRARLLARQDIATLKRWLAKAVTRSRARPPAWIESRSQKRTCPTRSTRSVRPE